MRSLTLGALASAASLLACSSTDTPATGTPGASGSANGGAGAGAVTSGGATSRGGASNLPQAGTDPNPSAGAGGGSAGGGSANGGTTNGGVSNEGGSAPNGGVASGGAPGCPASTPMPAPTPTTCPAADGNTPPDVALTAVNDLRAHMSLPCMSLVTEITTSSQKHCDYYQQNMANKTCIANAHAEVSTCAGFVAEMFFTRMTDAGYKGSPRSEVMAFSGNPTSALGQWINSVYHRTPLLSPWIREMGYGMTADCDTIDMGQGDKTPDDATAVYPYPGQLDLPVSFDGSHEGPMPPVPPSGWPSASPIHLYVKNYTVTSHDVFVSAGCAPLAHQWLPDKEQYILYPDKPFAKGTEYRVVIAGTKAGKPLSFDWTFTTKNRRATLATRARC